MSLWHETMDDTATIVQAAGEEGLTIDQRIAIPQAHAVSCSGAVCPQSAEH